MEETATKVDTSNGIKEITQDVANSALDVEEAEKMQSNNATKEGVHNKAITNETMDQTQRVVVEDLLVTASKHLDKNTKSNQNENTKCVTKTDDEQLVGIEAQFGKDKNNSSPNKENRDKNESSVSNAVPEQPKQQIMESQIKIEQTAVNDESNLQNNDIQIPKTINEEISHLQCISQSEQQRENYEHQLEQLRAALTQKDNMIALFQRENAILEKEKHAFRKEKDMANKEKESTVIKFAMKEKLLIDAKKEKETIEKHLADAKKEIKNVSTRFQAINEEKSRITYMMDEKCNEVRKYQRECEKLKTDYGHLESKLKYHVNKLNMEIEAKMALERKLEEERNAPNKLEEKANEKLKMEFEASTILLKHEIKKKTEIVENLTKENHKYNEKVKQLQEQLNKEISEKTQITSELELLREEHNSVENAYSEEMLNSEKLRSQLDELQVLKTQNTLNEEKICILNETIKDMTEKLQDNSQDLMHLRAKEEELLSINKEMSESIVGLQNEICLLKAKAQGIEAENQILKMEKSSCDIKYKELAEQLKCEEEQKTEERQLLAKHLSEKTKLYEMTKIKLENILGDFEATKNKHATVVKELQREIQKYKKSTEQGNANSQSSTNVKQYCSCCQANMNGRRNESSKEAAFDHDENIAQNSMRTHSRNSSHSSQSHSSRRPSDSSESETVVSSATAIQNDLQGPSKKHLVERILRLQQASARQTEKIDFLENHTLSLVSELQKKSKVVQYYMIRDQAGALTSTKSDQNKSDLAKYGNGVMSAIYNGIKGDTKSMNLELSLEINKKLQAVLEDTLLKNITLKENLDVLGLEVDTLTRKLRQLEAK